ncbi:Phage head-tail joining protein [compost metagenome]
MSGGINLEAGKLNHKLEIWHNAKFKNELSEWDNEPRMYKKIWAQVIPQTGNMTKRQGIETIMTNVTHKIIVRYNSGMNITSGMWFKYREHRFDIKFILNPYFSNESLEIFCEEVKG